MLVLSLNKHESLVINDDITVAVVDIRGDRVRLGVELPAHDCTLHRRELYDASHGEASTTVMIPESGMKALKDIRSRITSLPPDNGALIAAVLEAVAAKGVSADDLDGLRRKI